MAHEAQMWPSSRREPSGFALAEDGVPVAYYELGGEGPPLLFAHATGFCAAVFAPLAALLPRYRCLALDARAHGASGRPPDEDFAWEGFGRDVLAVVDHLGMRGAVGFGHSAGGAALLLAEEQRPGTFGGLYLFEPIVHLSDEPPPPAHEGDPLSAAAIRRRDWFPGREAALRNFSAKPPLDVLHPAVLAAYVDNGFAPDEPGGIRLRCRPQDEARVYAFGHAHSAYSGLGGVRCPVTVAWGEHTTTLGPAVFAAVAARAPHGQALVVADVGHFGPLERPDTVAGSLLASSALAAT